jgi:ubiquinone/menaquinone biosynthesis C-methylase UbiE
MRIDRARAVAEAIRRRVPLTAGMTALEYGCGTGLLSFALQPYLARITCADSSPGMLAVLQAKLAAGGLQNMTPVRLDLSVDPLPAERYDLIYTLMTLHHIPDADKVLASFHSLLNESGYLCIADLDKEDGSFHGPDFAGHNGFDRNELSGKLEHIGFGNISFTTVYQTPRQVDGVARTFALFLMAAERN